jgi:hypothetical protein
MERWEFIKIVSGFVDRWPRKRSSQGINGSSGYSARMRRVGSVDGCINRALARVCHQRLDGSGAWADNSADVSCHC